MDIDRLSGSAPGGVITAADVTRAPAPFEMAVPGNGRPMKSMEKAIARAMASSISMPTFRVTSHIRLEVLMAAAKSAGVSVTVAVAKACALAISKHPKMNWCYQPDDKLIEREQVDIGMAVAADDGGLGHTSSDSVSRRRSKTKAPIAKTMIPASRAAPRPRQWSKCPRKKICWYEMMTCPIGLKRMS